MSKLQSIVALGIILGLGIGGFFLIPKAFASGDKKGDDEDLPNPVTSSNLQVSPNEFTDGQSVGYFWTITGGSGRFRGILRPGDGSRINISESEFIEGRVFHVFELGNLTTQNRNAILQIIDIETGVSYNEDAEFIVNPIDDIPGTPDYPIVISQNGPFRITENNELIVKLNYENITNRDTGPVTVFFQVRNPNRIVKWLSFSPIGNIKPNAITTLEFKTSRLAIFSAGLEWVAEFFVHKSSTDPRIMANKLEIGFRLPRENNP